jgi:CHAT domain-containing protein
MKLFWIAALAWIVGIAFAPAQAQTESEDRGNPAEELDTTGPRLSPAEAAQLLAQPLPAEADERYALLQRQFSAARVLENRPRALELVRALADAGRGRPGGEDWIRIYLNFEFSWGASGKALEASEAFVGDAGLSASTRAAVALRQTYFAAQGNDRAVTLRLWQRADGLARAVVNPQTQEPLQLAHDHLAVRADILRIQGDSAGAVATLRQAVGLGRRHVQATRVASGPQRETLLADAQGLLDGTLGQLTYALVQQGRPQEAIDLGQQHVAQWRAGQLPEALGARWNYRLANALVATQQYETGLAAATLSDQMLERLGAQAASHTRWLARQEIVRALIGLKRWKEADESYRGFMAAMPPDTLARTRASDNRLLALLAAKNGRFEEAADTVERMHRFRLRLYGANHPLTHEAAGVRAVVRLLRGEVIAAMSDYETLFATTLDTPGGWVDLDTRGVRGYVLGIAFDEFMQHVAERSLKGEKLSTSITDRALQVADRTSIGTTQRAITDSTARVLAATPQLKALLEQEQTLRQQSALAFARLNTALVEEDRQRREVQSEAFKAKPEPERKALLDKLSAQRERIKTVQSEAGAARTALEAQRGNIARDYPAYADLVTPSTPKPEQLRRLLGAGESLLVLHHTDSATLVWLLGADGQSHFTASPLSRSALAERTAGLRSMLDLGAAPAGQRPALQTAALHGLYRELLGPLDAALRDTRSLVVATSGPLASLPLAALVTEPPSAGASTAWLARRTSVTQLPSPASLQALRRGAQNAAAPKAMLGFGDPLFDLGKPAAAGGNKSSRYDAEWGFRYAQMPPLPDTRSELLAVAQALGADGKADVVLGAQATRRAVLTANLSDRRVVAFATHGLMPGELPGVSKPALAMAADADERESPLLELDDVLGLRLNAQWVLLSACNTAAGEQGGAAMSGLVRGFFFAGTRSVLATHWAVETESAAALSVATFQSHARGQVGRAESLRLAQLAMVDGQLGAGRWTHPFYWAPYALFGDPAR